MFVSLDLNGVPTLVTSRDSGGLTPVPPGVNPEVSMLVSEVWVPRPFVATPVVVGGEMQIVGAPIGTLLEIVDIMDDVVLFMGPVEGEETVDFPDTGRYQVELSPPAPWLGWRGILTC